MKIYLILFCLVCFMGCQKENNPISPTEDSTFGIYLLKDNNIKIHQITNKSINELELESTPWLTSSDIAFYDFSSHYIYLNKSNNEFFTNGNNIKWDGQPFIVVANNKRCYIGCFYSGYSSVAITTPYIDELNIQMLPTDILVISYGDLINDKRNDENVAYDLAVKNKLHKGLSLLIKDVNVISNSDSAIVQYTYTIKNNDSNNLYVLDPDNMGSNLFHYYMIGLSFHNSNEHISSDYSEVEKPEPYDLWKPEWFTKIRSDSLIDRTVVLKGYPHIPSGTYKCSFYFSSPINIDMGDREISDGRYWLGTIHADIIKYVTE